ncbi:hypothetical protein SK128_018768 [Halocaridina rubra]|uniref:Sulfotransferase domain-containing protein n=1 Tax=Halocaridina rubra TaxID=373956 RepID=A0AAN9A2Q1_HALRR
MAFKIKVGWITISRRILLGALILLLGLRLFHILDIVSYNQDSQSHWLRGRPVKNEAQNLPLCNSNETGTRILAGIFNKLHRQTKPPPNILLIGSYGRSGTSFLGGLLKSIPGVFYYYEPLYNLEQWHMLTRPLAVQSLKDLFICNFTGPVFTAIKERGKNYIRNKYMETCGSKSTCLESTRLSSACSSEPIRMIKTIRMRLSWLEPLLHDTKLDLRVIHILRDPRGAVISNWKAGWDIPAETLCGNLLEDLETAQDILKRFPNRYVAVRYEDICADAKRIANIVFHFLGYANLLPSANRFLTRMTSEEAGDEYSLRRNTSQQLQQWRTKITEEELKKIETTCSKAINKLGFHLFRNINNTRNLSIPLYNQTSFNPLFGYRDCVNV